MFGDFINLVIQRYSMDSYNVLDKIVTIPFSIIFLGIYNLVHSYGFAIIVFTVIAKLVLLPVSAKGKKSMMKQSRLTPKVTEIQKKYPNDRVKQQQEIQRLYAEEKVSMAGCLWNLLPLPIMIALYAVIRLPLTNLLGLTLPEIQNIAMTCFNFVYEKTTYGELELARMIQENFALVQSHFPDMLKIDFRFFGIDLTIIPSWRPDQWTGMTLIPVFAGVISFFSARFTQKINPMPMPAADDKSNPAAGMTKSMLYTMPLMSVWFGFIMPAAMSLYLILNSILTMIQEYFLTKKYKKYFAELDAVVDAQRALEREKEEEERKKQAELREQGLTQMNPNTSKRKNVKEIAPSKEMKKLKVQQEPKKQPANPGDTTAGEIGGRKYARGRAYVADRYDNPENVTANPDDLSASPETDTEVLVPSGDMTQQTEAVINDTDTYEAEVTEDAGDSENELEDK